MSESTMYQIVINHPSEVKENDGAFNVEENWVGEEYQFHADKATAEEMMFEMFHTFSEVNGEHNLVGQILEIGGDR